MQSLFIFSSYISIKLQSLSCLLTKIFVNRQLQARPSAIKFYCQRAREDFSLVFLREIACPCERLEILRGSFSSTSIPKVERRVVFCLYKSACFPFLKLYSFNSSKLWMFLVPAMCPRSPKIHFLDFLKIEPTFARFFRKS